jgi:hypothetical protein
MLVFQILILWRTPTLVEQPLHCEPCRSVNKSLARGVQHLAKCPHKLFTT